MAGTRDTYRIARVALTALAGMLLASIAITYLIGASKLSTSESSASDTARVLVQEDLSTFVVGADLVTPVNESRARELDDLIDGAILNGEIDAVTIWDPDGTIVFSSDSDLIGTRLPEERFRLRDILKMGTASSVEDGMFSTRVPLAPEGTDAEAVAQLDRVYAPIWDTTSKPWRTASLSLSLVLLVVLGAIYQVSRMASRRWKSFAGTTFQTIRGRKAPELAGANGTDPAYVQPDFRKAEEELASAEVRATTAEERAAALQEQYRKTLEELHTAQTKLEGAAPATPSRPDPEFEERLLKAEGRARLLEGQLQSVKTERDKLAHDVQERQEATAPDPKVEQRARSAEAEVASLRSEVETARHEVAGMVKELESTRRDREQLSVRIEDAANTQAAADAAKTEAMETGKALVTARAELGNAAVELQAARTEVENLRTADGRAAEAERRVAQLDDRSRSLEADLAQARAAADGRTDEAHAAAEAMTSGAESRAALAEMRATQEAERAGRAETTLAELEAATEADVLQARASAAAEVAKAQELAEAMALRLREIEAAATGDVAAAVAQLDAANARASQTQTALEAESARAAEAKTALEAESARASEAQDVLESARRDTAAARAEAESFRATAGMERAELEDTFRAELESREQQLVGHLEARDHDLAALHTREAELVAEIAALEAETSAQLVQKEAETSTQLVQREQDLRTVFAADQAASFAKLKALGEADRARFEADRAKREADEVSLRAEADDLRAKLESATTRLGASGSDLRAARTDVERLEAQAGGASTELQTVWSELETAQQELTTALDQIRATEADLEVARTEAKALRAGSADSDGALRETREETEGLRRELTDARQDLARTQADVQAELERASVTADRTAAVERELQESSTRTAVAARELEEMSARAAAAEHELQESSTRTAVAARELEEMSARAAAAEHELQEASTRTAAVERELQEGSMRTATAEHELERLHREVEISGHELDTLREIAATQATTAQERAALEEMLRVTQERLSGSNDRTAEIEERAETSQQALAGARLQVEELEGRLRQIEMSQAVKAMRREDAEPSEAAPSLEVAEGTLREDRRASSPFMKELSLDAKKSLTSILGLSLTLKHKNQPKEQAPLLRQLAAYARRLDHTVADLLDADRLAKGDVELHLRRTDLEALVQRVVEESQVGNDHDVRLQTERIVASVDPVRTEQLLMGLLRGATDRTPLGSAITIRLSKGEGGALISVEDMETSSDASLSPVVARFADIQGGWAKVESRPNGGSAFRVFLPAEGIMPDSPAEDADPEIELTVSAPRTDLEIVVSEELDEERALTMAAEDDDPWAAGQLLVQELQKLSRDD